MFVDSKGKPIPRNAEGRLVSEGVQKFEVIESETTDSPLTDDAGNVIEAGTEEALIRKVKEHFEGKEDTTVVRVIVRRTETSAQISGEQLAALK